MQENDKQNRIITVQGYYQNLTKKEKSKMLQYLCVKYCYVQNTIRTKMTNVYPMKDYELRDIESTIKNEAAWRL